ncbi:MAG: hypothetical protein ACQKBU_08995 [Verrucomicrobiales bacterium]
MNRFVRIALTCFASSTVLVFILRQRTLRLQDSIDAGIADDFARDEQRMIILGLLLAGGLGVTGFILIILAFLKRK